MPSPSRVPVSLSAVITGLPAGEYEFGLRGGAGVNFSTWNNNGGGYTSVLVYR